jgi:hypothetical protein
MTSVVVKYNTTGVMHIADPTKLENVMKASNLSNSFGLKVLACAAASIALTVGFSWSFVESTAVVYGMAGDTHPTLSVESAHGGAPLAPFGAAVSGRSATLVG